MMRARAVIFALAMWLAIPAAQGDNRVTFEQLEKMQDILDAARRKRLPVDAGKMMAMSTLCHVSMWEGRFPEDYAEVSRDLEASLTREETTRHYIDLLVNAPMEERHRWCRSLQKRFGPQGYGWIR